ncbi:T6SS immunity protein Tdi1 domain-containing protein [Labilithrix luteola]|nr:T6SS immunity protein Tdi1 domain-containing protein [Labilithrix luteola]
MTTPFSQMHESYPPSAERTAYQPKRHARFAAKVPPEIAAEWNSFGFGAYGGGLVWFTPPDKPVLQRRDWDFLDGTGIEILRTAFGNVCVWQGGKFLWLNVHTGKVGTFPPIPRIMFGFTLCVGDFRKNVLMEPLFRKAKKKLGELGADEVYGFAPLPALGGAIAEEYLIKTDAREYVALAGSVLSA